MTDSKEIAKQLIKNVDPVSFGKNCNGESRFEVIADRKEICMSILDKYIKTLTEYHDSKEIFSQYGDVNDVSLWEGVREEIRNNGIKIGITYITNSLNS